jgi:hypothetical protein
MRNRTHTVVQLRRGGGEMRGRREKDGRHQGKTTGKDQVE